MGTTPPPCGVVPVMDRGSLRTPIRRIHSASQLLADSVPLSTAACRCSLPNGRARPNEGSALYGPLLPPL